MGACDISEETTPAAHRLDLGGITGIDAWRVRVPLRAPLRTALGDNGCSDAGIVQVTTETGHAGIGEISSIWYGGGGRLCREVVELVSPVLIGLPAAHRSSVLARAREAVQGARPALPLLAALDMALLDIAGKALGQPVFQLLGGPVRESVDLSMSVSIADPEAALAEASLYLERGFRALKVKGDANSERLLQTVRALRTGLGESWTLRVDLNMAYTTAEEALSVIQSLEPFGVTSVEQPLGADDLEGARFLTANSPVPIMLDESIWTPDDARRAVSMRACDLVNIYVSEAGGITAAHEIAVMCATANIGTVVGSMPELATGTAAAAHLAFAMPRLDQPSDVCGHLYHSGEVVHHSLEVRNGRLLAPDTPGLGVSIDHERLDYYRTEF